MIKKTDTKLNNQLVVCVVSEKNPVPNCPYENWWVVRGSSLYFWNETVDKVALATLNHFTPFKKFYESNIAAHDNSESIQFKSILIQNTTNTTKREAKDVIISTFCLYCNTCLTLEASVKFN